MGWGSRRLQANSTTALSRSRKSPAMNLKPGIFQEKDPRKIARSPKASAVRSERRKSEPYRSAMSMLTFYINRAGDTLPKARKKRLETVTDELRTVRQARAGEEVAHRHGTRRLHPIPSSRLLIPVARRAIARHESATRA
jgi:hypothetical protein